jgi:hypothetical protein
MPRTSSQQRPRENTTWARSEAAIHQLSTLLDTINASHAAQSAKSANAVSLPRVSSTSDRDAATQRRSEASPIQLPTPASSPTLMDTQSKLSSGPQSPCWRTSTMASTQASPRHSESRVLPRPPLVVEPPFARESPQRAIAITHNKLAPWDKASMWRALRSDQVEPIERQIGAPGDWTGTMPRPPPSRESLEVTELASRTAKGNVPATFFTRMLLRAAPQTRNDHLGVHHQVVSKRRNVEAW